MTPRSQVRSTLIDVAFDLFDERGFGATTVDDIAARAGVGRTTFFRHFGSKEAVVFPDHDELLAQIESRLMAAAPSTRDVAVTDAARIVLRHYLQEGRRAHARYRLIRTVPALRDREVASMRQYQRMFRDALRADWVDDPMGPLRAELMAAGIVTAHNVVLRQWLRGELGDAESALDQAITMVLEQSAAGRSTSTSVVIVESTAPAAVVAQRVRDALRVTDDGAGPSPEI